MKTLFAVFAACTASTILAPMSGAQVVAQLRSGHDVNPAGFLVAPTAPAGGLVVGRHFWGGDNLLRFVRYDPFDAKDPDPVNLGSLFGDQFFSSSIVNRSGQVAFDGHSTAYVADPSQPNRGGRFAGGIKRLTFDIANERLSASQDIATTAGLAGDGTTAVALGPDGNLYVGFLRNGTIKRVIAPAAGTTQTVQAVGTAQTRSMRALAFVGGDLYLAGSDGLFVIPKATSAACQGGCNAQLVHDGFAGTAHVGLTTDGIDKLYFAASNQVWRYSIARGFSTGVASSGVTPAGRSFALDFVAGQTNLLALDRLGNLWIGDDPTDGKVPFQGRIWYVPSASLATLP